MNGFSTAKKLIGKQCHPSIRITVTQLLINHREVIYKFMIYIAVLNIQRKQLNKITSIRSSGKVLKSNIYFFINGKQGDDNLVKDCRLQQY